MLPGCRSPLVLPSGAPAGYIVSISRSTRSSWARNGSFKQHGALGLVVELQVHPVDGEVAPRSLALRMNSPRRRARVVCGGCSTASVDRLVGHDPLDHAPRACSR